VKRTDTIIIGGGQAGLAMSRCLAERGIDHVVLERGRVGERWRSERWDSLRLLTPRWQSRLPGWHYRGPDPTGFMTKSEVADYLERYARAYSAPVEAGVTVHSLARNAGGFRAETSQGVWTAPSVVIATGHCDRPLVPSMANALAPAIAQVVPTRYRNPEQLGDGGVLVVGASATGIQLAAEIARSGRAVTLAVGRHTRFPRTYRGRDIMDWFAAAGVLTESARDVWDLEASRRQPSLQLVGSDDHHTLDLAAVQRDGVRVVGRMLGAFGRRVYLAGDLEESLQRADRKMNEQLERIDRFVERSGLDAMVPAAERPARIRAPEAPHRLDLAAEHIDTVLWATGYRREYPWLHVPVCDARGELLHDGGVTPVPGLYALGLNFMRRRNSSFLDGVGADAAELAAHIETLLARQRVATA
jgi:putative flavoprotein involved in K+ transport